MELLTTEIKSRLLENGRKQSPSAARTMKSTSGLS